MMKRAFLSYLVFLIGLTAVAQDNIGIGTLNPNPNALLDLTSDDKGLLIPRLATVDRLNINPNGLTDQGLLVFDTDAHLFYYWNGTAWIPISLNGLSGFNLSLSFDSTSNVLTIEDNGGVLSTTIDVNDDDSDSTNELQTLALSQDTLSISGGNSVLLPPPTVSGIPFLTQAQINALNPVPGTIVYNITTNTMNMYDGNGWIQYGGNRITSTNVTNGGMPCVGNPTITIGGEIYPTVQIGSQCWMAKNLNLGTIISPSTTPSNNGVVEKYCYNNSLAMCDSLGGLYEWFEVMNYVTNSSQGICPNGWHIPTENDISILVDNLGGINVAGTALQPNGGSGFDFLIAGLGYLSPTANNTWSELGVFGRIWSSYFRSNQFGVFLQYFVVGYYGSAVGTGSYGNYDSEQVISCRCIKD